MNKFNNDFKDKISYIGIEPQRTPFEKKKKTYQGFKNLSEGYMFALDVLYINKEFQ